MTKDQRKKPIVHIIYDPTKGDFVYLLSTTQIKSRRWLLNALAFILDTCRSNAKTILQDNGIKLANFEMTYNFGKELVLPAIRRRYSQSNGLKVTVIKKIRCVFGINEVSACTQLESFNPTSGRCFKCVEAIVGKKSYKAESEKLNNKLKIKYLKCQKFICKKHQTELQFIFEDCIE